MAEKKHNIKVAIKPFVLFFILNSIIPIIQFGALTLGLLITCLVSSIIPFAIGYVIYRFAVSKLEDNINKLYVTELCVLILMNIGILAEMLGFN